MSNNAYLPNKAFAEKIAASYHYLIGHHFDLKHHNNNEIDRIDVIDAGNGNWEVILVHDIFKPSSIAEFYSFRCPTINIFEYFAVKNIRFDAKSFGL
jgi:hypothetical protein